MPGSTSYLLPSYFMRPYAKLQLILILHSYGITKTETRSVIIVISIIYTAFNGFSIDWVISIRKWFSPRSHVKLLWCHRVPALRNSPVWQQLLFRVIDASHQWPLRRDDHWIQRHNNGIADRESHSRALVPGYYLNCTCRLHLLLSFTHATQAPDTRARASPCTLPSPGDCIVLSWPDSCLFI